MFQFDQYYFFKSVSLKSLSTAQKSSGAVFRQDLRRAFGFHFLTGYIRVHLFRQCLNLKWTLLALSYRWLGPAQGHSCAVVLLGGKRQMDPCFGRLPGDSLKYSEGLDLKYATPMSKETASSRSRGWWDKQPTVYNRQWQVLLLYRTMLWNMLKFYSVCAQK